jgi:DNA-binding XRE family transcriptional regulator
MTVATREPLKSSNPGKARKMSRRTNLNGREVRGMTDETEECRHRVAINQRQLAQAIGSTQRTAGQLERCDRGAYLRTIVRLCECLGVAPEDLLSGDSPSEPKKSVDRIRR